MKKVTLKDIATSLGVTVGTVSHVFNGIDDISEETKKRVLQKARELGYITNSAAVSLRSGKTNTIAVIVPDISNPHIAYQVKLIEDKMRDYNYSVIILNTNENEEIEYRAIVTACSKRVDGILICPAQHGTENIEFLNKQGIPFILIGRYFKDFDCDYICADDEKGGFEAGKFLLSKGCRKPLYIGVYDHIEGSVNRFEGLCRAFLGKDIDVLKTSPNDEEVEKTVEEIVRREEQFDSLVIFSDLIAFKIMSSLCIENKPTVSFDAIHSHLCLPFYTASVGMVDGGWAELASSAIIDKINGLNKECKKLIDVRLSEFDTDKKQG